MISLIIYTINWEILAVEKFCIEGWNRVFFTLAKIILEKELIYACEARSIVVCVCARVQFKFGQ